MSAETSAVTALLNAVAVTNIVGQKVYPDAVPQEQPLPCVAIIRDETEYITTIHSGVPLGSTVILDVWCMASTRSAAEALTDAVETAIGAAGFSPRNRKPAYDSETATYSTILTVSF